jgi:hypothetical protein
MTLGHLRIAVLAFNFLCWYGAYALVAYLAG